MTEALTKEERATLQAAREAGATGTVIDLLARLEQVEAERDELRQSNEALMEGMERLRRGEVD